MAIFRLVLFLGFFPLIAFAITINPFSPKWLTATWDSGIAGSISNAGGAWNLDASNFTYDGGVKNSPFCQGCNVSFGAAAGGAAGVVTVTGIQNINSFTFNSGPTGNFTLTGGEISCVNFSPCIYTANYSGTIGSVISGSKDLIKQGAQTLTLSGINTYTGNTNVNAGTLEATTNVEAIPGNLIIAAGATGHLNVTGNPTFSNNVSGQGTLKVTPGGTSGNTTSLSGNLSGLIGLFDIYPYPAVGGGKIRLFNPNQLNTPPIGSTIRLNSGATIFLDQALNYESNFELYGGTTGETLGQLRVENATVTGPVTLLANSSVGARVDTGTISGEISGIGFGITKEGGGNIVLTNSNTYTGPTTISGGTLQISGWGNLGSGSYAGAISNSGTFQYSSNSAQTLSGVISGAGTFTKDTSTTSMLTLTGANTYTGTTSVSAGTLKLTNTNTSPTFNISGGAILELNVPTAATQSVAVNQTFNGTGTIRKTGVGLIQWPPVATYALGTGAMIDVQAGTFIGGNSDNDIWTTNLSDLNVAGGATFNGVEANVRVDSLSGTGTITSGHQVASYLNFTFGVDNGGGTFDGVLGNFSIWAGNFVKAGSGTQILTGANTYTGTTTINGGGTLQISGSGSLNLGSYAGAISFAGSSRLQYSSSTNQTLSGIISGAGNILKDTSISTLSATANNTITGTVTVDAGTFFCNYPGAVGSAITVKSGVTLSLGDNTSGLNNWSAPLIFSGPTSGTNALLLLTSLTNLPDHTWSGTIALNTPTTFDTAHQVRPNYFTGIISGASPLTLISSGGAAFTFSGNSNYSGGTTIQSGTLRLNHTSGAGTGVINIGNGGLSLYRSGGTTTYPNSITSTAGTTGFLNVDGSGSDAGVSTNSIYDTGAITVNGTLTIARTTGGNGHTYFSGDVNGAGTLKINNTNGGVAPSGSTLGRCSLNGTFGFTGDVQVLAGGNFLANNVSVNSVDIAAGGYWTLGANPATNMLTGSGTITTPASAGVTTLQVGGTSSSSSFSGVIGQTALGALGTVALSKVGTGTLTLSGANTYTGATTVTGGNLSFNPANTSIGSTSGITISGGSQVNLISGVGFNYTQNWVFSGTGGSIYLTQPSGAVNFTVSGTIALNGPGTIHGNKDQTTTISGLISGNSPLTLNSDNAHTNNFSLTGNNTYTGGTTIYNGGKVTCGHIKCLGTGTVTVNAGGFLNCQNWEITNGIINNGGTIQNCRRTFLASSNFTVPTGVTSIQYLVVAGGGGGGGRGGANVSGAGGGAGGFLTGTVAVVPGNTYAITVGAGGAESINNSPTRGGDSSIGALVTAVGGGGGGAGGGSGNLGASGGSGGGTVGNNFAGGTGTAGQGNNGGKGSTTNVGSNVIGAGGGGGAGGVGTNGRTTPGISPGGPGLSSSFSGAAVTYATGGDGGDYPSNTSGASGAANTGNGGDGAGGTAPSNGGSGGSGIVIILPY